MPIENRKVMCDVCGTAEEEERFGVGWPNWVIVNGIGAVAPKEGEPLCNRNFEMYVCPNHKAELAQFLDDMQTWHNSNSFIKGDIE